MRRHWFPKPYADLAARLRVPFGFLLLAAFLWLSDPSPRSLLLGLPVSVVGLWLRGWAAGHLAKNQTLTTGGPYAWVRNPLYLGTLTTATGIAVASRSASLAILFAIFFVFLYLPAIELEEQYLRQLFPGFDGYAERVPMLLPRVPHARPASRFRWSLYLRNQEYKALLGFLTAVAVLCLKTWL
jgi:protein-S-isoprenylcysteine O-methyltransferase Ste14